MARANLSQALPRCNSRFASATLACPKAMTNVIFELGLFTGAFAVTAPSCCMIERKRLSFDPSTARSPPWSLKYVNVPVGTSD
jgi:hypothetical protein